MLVIISREVEVSCLEAVSEQYIEEWTDGVDLGEIGCTGGLSDKEGKGKVHEVTEKTACNGGYTIP